MNLDLSKLPDDAAALKEIIAFHLTNEEKYQERIDYLEQMVRLLQIHRHKYPLRICRIRYKNK